MSNTEGIQSLTKQHQRKTTQLENKGLPHFSVKEHREVSLMAHIPFDIELGTTAGTTRMQHQQDIVTIAYIS